MPTTPRRPGRPRVGTKVQVLIPDEHLAVVDALAERADTTRSDVIRDAVADRVTLETRGLHEWVQQRADASALGFPAVAHELAQAREVYAAELRSHAFTVPELCLVADVLNGTMPTPGVGAGTVAWSVEDACQDARSGPLPSPYGERWGVDEDVLVGKLRALGPAADLAVRFAVARFWASPDVDAADAEVWRALGFAVEG